MSCRFWLLSLLCLACDASPEAAWPTPGAETVLDYGRANGLARSPLWCRSWSSMQPEICHRMLPDGSQIGFQRGMTGRAHQFSHGWNRISPVRAFDLRDSIRRDLERRGARRIGEHPMPAAPKSRIHGLQAKWCLDSAVVHLSHSWQEGQPFEFVYFLVGSVADPDCSAEAFRALPRPDPRMHPAGPRGGELRSDSTLLKRDAE